MRVVEAGMTKSLRNFVIGLAAVVAGLWFVRFVSESEMRRLDKEVARLCAIDGGMRIFETASLCAMKFSDYGPAWFQKAGTTLDLAILCVTAKRTWLGRDRLRAHDWSAIKFRWFGLKTARLWLKA
jgi:hypothetical protein